MAKHPNQPKPPNAPKGPSGGSITRKFRLTARVDPDLHEAVKAAARGEGVSVSQYIADTLRAASMR